MSVRQASKGTSDGRKWIFQAKYEDIDGTIKRYTSKKYATKQEAKIQELAFLTSLTKNKSDYSDMTFETLYMNFMEYQKDRIKATSLNNYNFRFSKLKSIQKLKLSKFDVAHYQMFREEIKKQNYSIVTKNDIHKFLRVLLNFAMKWYKFDFTDVIDKMEKFKDPNSINKEMKFYTFEEFKHFISFENDLRYKCAFNILYFCGLRRGELLGLTWDNVNLFRKEMNIRKNVVISLDGNKYNVTSPKTKSSIRTIPIPNFLVEDLKKLKEDNKECYGFQESWFVLGSFEPIPFNSLRSHKDKLCDLSGLPRIRIHDFRHSCASLLISKGANITLVARFLGHTKIDETLNTYSHFFKSDLDNIVNVINGLQ